MTRGLGFVGVLLVSLATGDMPVATLQVALVALIAVLAQVGTIPARPVWLRYAVLIAEAAAIALVVVTSAPGDRPSIVYLAVPPIVSAFAIASSGLGDTSVSAVDADEAEARASARRTPDGMGSVCGAFECKVAERSSSAATGDVRGRKWGW